MTDKSRMLTKLLVVLVVAASPHKTSGGTTVVLDLSHQPHLNRRTVTDTIQSTLAELSDVHCIDLDLSYSEMGNTGLVEMLQSLSSSSVHASISLTARMNRLTPKGAGEVLEQLMTEKTHSEESLSRLKISSLDLGWNNLHPDEDGSKAFLSSLRKLLECSNRPHHLRLDCCSLGPGACRAIGKGIMNRLESGGMGPISLSLFGNKDVGDAGIAALAAAIRGSTSNSELVVFERLDLSGCDVGDVGAEALAMALESHPGCIKHLDLSNNEISNNGAIAIGRALSSGSQGGIHFLDMSNNPNLGNTGASALASAMACGTLQHLVLRSCSVQAEGAKSFGDMLKTLSAKKISEWVKIDLSGNPLGILRKVKKGQKYSASALKSKASATTVSYMNFIGKKIKSGLKEVGLDGVADSFVNTSESDDEEEERMGSGESADDVDPSKARCGAKAFASSIVVGEHELGESKSSTEKSLKCELGLRHCCFDEGAADALASTILQARDRFGIDLSIDVRMSPALEEELVEALATGCDGTSDRLEDMSERHMQALEVIRTSELRAMEAVAASRKRAAYEENEYDFTSMDFDAREGNGGDSDAAYDDEGEFD